MKLPRPSRAREADYEAALRSLQAELKEAVEELARLRPLVGKDKLWEERCQAANERGDRYRGRLDAIHTLCARDGFMK